MADILVEFWSNRQGRRLFVIQVHAAGGFEVIEGDAPAPILDLLETEAIAGVAGPETDKREFYRLHPKVSPRDGLLWARALPNWYSSDIRAVIGDFVAA